MRRRTLAFAFVALFGCDTRLPFGAFRRGDVHDGGAQGGDGSVCAPVGGRYDLGDGPGVVCEGGQRRAHRYALCSCSDIQNSGTTTVDAFDSARGAYTPGDASGSLGANANFYPREGDVGGSVVVAGDNGIPLGGDLHVGGNLLDQGQLDGTSFTVTVDGDVRVGGQVNVGDLVASSLVVPEGVTVNAGDSAPEVTRAPVAVDPPCDCDDPLDVPAEVLAHVEDNDNALIGLDPAEGLRSLAGALELTLPCGRYYVDAFYAPNPITLTITGPVELYVKGSMVADRAGTIDIQFTAGGELDLFVEKGFSVANRFEVGWPEDPTRARIYAGGEDTLFFAGPSSVGASLYAPSGQLVSSGPFELWGAMFVGRISSSASLTLHYDRALARDKCTTDTCTGDCGTLACLDGACASCASDDDCADGVRCDQGLCLP